MKSPHSSKEQSPETHRLSRSRKAAIYFAAGATLVTAVACGTTSKSEAPGGNPPANVEAHTKTPKPTVETPKPTTPAPTVKAIGSFFLHTNIETTTFYVGEPGNANDGYIPNVKSTWDEHWKDNFGGVDEPKNRNGYLPAGFTPKENAFYVALPYSDYDEKDVRKPNASACLRFSGKPATDYSWCKNIFVEVTYNGKTALGQLEDAGPYGEDDAAYVLGTARPKNEQPGQKKNKDDLQAGLDVSQALADYLGLNGDNKTSWRFIRTADVPAGPWTIKETSTLGRPEGQ